MNIERTLLQIVMLIFLAGCSTWDNLHDQYVVNAAVVPNSLHPVSGANPPGPINLDCYVFEHHQDDSIFEVGPCKGWRKPLEGNMTAYKYLLTQVNNADTEGGKFERNILILEIERRSNEICHIHKAHILSNASAISFLTGFTSTVLSGVSAVVSGGSATALSLASSATGTLGSEIRANFYQKILAPAINRKIDELRKKKYEKIESGTKEAGNEYSITRAVRDLEEFHRECSFYCGVTELAEGTREEPLTRAEIDSEIKQLQDDNAALVPKFASNSTLHGDVQDAAHRQWRLSTNRIEQLLMMRLSAPGKVPVKTISENQGSENTPPGSAPSAPVTSEALPDHAIAARSGKMI